VDYECDRETEQALSIVWFNDTCKKALLTGSYTVILTVGDMYAMT